MPTPTVLVTGASSGFGLLGSVELAKRGLRVFATMRDPSKATDLEQAARAAGVTIEVLQLDITDAASIAACKAEVERRAGDLDILVNNAGYGLGGFFEDLDLDEVRAQFETNVFGQMAVTQAFLPRMRERRLGRVVNVSSGNARLGTPGLSAYSASKWALEGWTEALRLEMIAFGVDVVIVQPGAFNTDIFGKNRRVARRAQDPASPYRPLTQRLERFVEEKIVTRTADPGDVGRMIAHAATVEEPRLRYMVGTDVWGRTLAKTLLPYKMLEKLVRRATGLDEVTL